ncbi:DUF3152 domain-containing protein [Tomitella gaofuii]|uniref:DUF3152 domain-containing protein n=1 Tax=Tomitella gaofuii TaxID=2760083 RepID=UPI0035561248
MTYRDDDAHRSRRPAADGDGRIAGAVRDRGPEPRYTEGQRVRDSADEQGGFSFPSWNQPLRARWDPTFGPQRPRARRSEREGIRRQTRLGRFVSQYGWRAYAIPVLVVVTVFVVIEAFRGGGTSSADAPSLGTRFSDVNGIVGAPVADGRFDPSVPSAALPDGGPFTVHGAGTFHIVPGTTGQVGQGTQHVYTYTVDVEDGVDTTGYGGDQAFASMVDHTLANPKSWINDPTVAFRRVDTPDADFHVALTSQMTVRQSCGYDIPVETSCYNADLKRVVLNEPRWVRGAVAFQGDIGSYRQYMVNHEIGHAIGYAQHQPCQSDGGLAPIMMQQTFGVANDDIAKLDPDGVVPKNGMTCHANPWPFPRS